jgi:uncharacterized protein
MRRVLKRVRFACGPEGGDARVKIFRLASSNGRGRRRRLAVLACLASIGLAVAWPGVPTAVAVEGRDAAPLAAAQAFKDPMQALEKYREDSRSGDVASSLEALRFAADGGQPLAEWKLGTMYRAGDGVPRDDGKAYDYFSRIVANYDEDQSDWRQDSLVSSAFVAVGLYSLNGLPSIKLAPDATRAAQMFQYAATRFGDSNAQYNLARLYLGGVGVNRDPEQAARWLNLAADKGHKDAEALLGDLLFKGVAPLQAQRALGLMYLTLAREAANDSKKDAWIIDLHDAALRAATEKEKQAARHYLEDFVGRTPSDVTAQR